MKKISFLLVTFVLLSNINFVSHAFKDNFEIDGILYTIFNDDSGVIVLPKDEGYSGDIFIPDQVEAPSGVIYDVLGAANFAFYKSENLTSVHLPSKTNCIGKGTFFMCHNLKKIECDSDNIKAFGKFCLQECLSLKEIPNTPKLRIIEDFAFSKCTSLETISIPRTVFRVGQSAFRDCSSLTSVEIDGSHFEVEDKTFKNCVKLKSINIESCYGKIGSKAFENCFCLESVKLPEEITSIERKAFKFCASLKQIDIPSDVTLIERFAFSHCSNLNEIYFHCCKLPEMRKGAFLAPQNSDQDIINVYVPYSEFNKYNKILKKVTICKQLQLHGF